MGCFPQASTGQDVVRRSLHPPQHLWGTIPDCLGYHPRLSRVPTPDILGLVNVSNRRGIEEGIDSTIRSASLPLRGKAIAQTGNTSSDISCRR